MQNDNENLKNNADIYRLKTSTDKAKDQTYFLWTLTQKQLAKTLFPVGGLKKVEVRKRAKKFKLPTAEKKDSQGLCFVGHVDIKEFLSRYIPQKRGDVLNEKGKVIGFHEGAHFLTIGERHGFTVFQKTPNDMPFYIISKNIRENTVTVAPKLPSYDISYESLRLSSVNWIADVPDTEKIYEARIRYHGKNYPCRLENKNTVRFIESPEALALGQSLVIYDNQQCLGGGVMEGFSI